MPPEKGSEKRLRAMAVPAFAAWSLLVSPHAALAATPMYYLRSFGPRGHAMAQITWGLFVLSIFVVVVISAMVLIGIFRQRMETPVVFDQSVPVTRSPGGIGWIYFGLALTLLILIGMTTWTVVTMAAIDKPEKKPAFTIDITGQQWWWQARYDDGTPSRMIETANELHIPVGEPVKIRLHSKDVIHSFWVPELSGKTDVIPGRVNETWIEADTAGDYRGQCAEYCGKQHAHMALQVFADPPEKFRAWWDHQLEAAGAPQTEPARNGQQVFETRCGICHTVRGTAAGGKVGPDLTHLMSRTTIASGTLPNTMTHLSGWIADPQGIKPGNKMPDTALTGPQLNAIRNYLQTLN